MVNRSTLSKGQLPAPPGLAPSPKSDDCSPSLPGSSGNGALANVGFDQDLRNNVPSVFRQSRKTAKDAHHQPSVHYEVRHAVTNTSPDHRQPDLTTPRPTVEGSSPRCLYRFTS
jgi:hypothetical protein